MISDSVLSGHKAMFRALIAPVITFVLIFLFKLYKARRKIVLLQKQGLPMPPYNLLFGHLLTLKNVVSNLPSDIHGQLLPNQIQQAFSHLGPIFYVDTWPINAPLLIVASPDAARQITQEHSLSKFGALRNFLRPITGESNLITMEGEQWKIWRSIFNPGFSANHMMSLVPGIMKEILTFCDILREHALKGAAFPLTEVTTNLAMDVIGRVTLDTRLNSQRSKNTLTSALRAQMPWLTFGNEINPFDRYHPLRPFIFWYNTRRMDQYISRELEARYAAHRDGQGPDRHNLGNSIIDLALEAYLAENSPKTTSSAKGMDGTFKSVATSQIKAFLFAGHDTTSTTLCYVLHLLSKNPLALQRLHSEHDSVFGPDLAQTASMIEDNPLLLNKLTYTVAVIKETLRLFPPASSTRAGEPGFSITDQEGRSYPTDGFLVWSIHHAIHRDPSYWPEPTSFLPERWIVPPGHVLHPSTKGAWRPFEFGPRSCIGQELAMLEMKIVLAMTAREFDIRAAYDEWDGLKGRKGPKAVDGERAYQMMSGGARPSDGFPCRVEVRDRTKGS